MSTKSKPQATDKKHEKDLASFQQLPVQTKELMKLKEQHEKTSGPGKVVTTRKIHDKASEKNSD